MRILSPNFVWRYPNRIINIHPSLLPAFPGASAYAQAYERGTKIVGVTSHYVTEKFRSRTNNFPRFFLKLIQMIR